MIFGIIKTAVYSRDFPRFAALVEEAAEACRGEKGCVHFEAGDSVTDEYTVVITEVWKSQKDLDDHLASPHWRKFVREKQKLDITEHLIYSYAAGRGK